LAWFRILEVTFIGFGEDTGGAVGERKGRHHWRPIVGAFKMVISEARTTSGRGCDEADASGRLAHTEEGGVVVATTASVIPRSEKEGMKPPYVFPGCLNHTHGNNMINRGNVMNKQVLFLT
jgi:hypothetical protein